ncbi:exosortase/archaeosortase family protein [Candidatus Woesearchaeota archaeon]|nr:MAG: exosortase/archaeosortase family protein [Candidatus Woesearchaeota archaeon]
MSGAKKEKGIKKYLKHAPTREFFIRTAVFGALLFGIQFAIMISIRHSVTFRKYFSIPEVFYFDFLSGLSKMKLLNSFLFVAVAFLIYIRRDLLKMKRHRQNWKQTAAYGIGAAAVLMLHYSYKYWIRSNLYLAMQHVTLLTVIKYLFNIAFVVLLAYAVYNKEFLHQFVKRFRKEIAAFSAVLVVYYILIDWFQRIWFFLSVFVSKVIYFLLSLTYKDAVLHVKFGQAPTLGAANFIVGVSKDCSGIDSLLLFISLFIFLWVLNRGELHQKRMIVLFILGIIGTIAYNLLRVYAIMLVGIHYDPVFAVDVFHTNAGWIMFLLFFGIFWNYGSRWVYK